MLAINEGSLDFGSRRAAEIGAALPLASIAPELEPFASGEGLAIEVRDIDDPSCRRHSFRKDVADQLDFAQNCPRLVRILIKASKARQFRSRARLKQDVPGPYAQTPFGASEDS